MKYIKSDVNLKKGLQREWLITNGIGGYASSTVIGANTRKYHGLLVAALTPPALRFLILSKLDESIEIGNDKYNLYSNVGKDFVADGTKYLESFEKDYLPVFNYKVKNIQIQKTICMQYGKNTVVVNYHIKNADKDIKLVLAPLLNYRDFHTINSNHKFTLNQEITKNKVKVIIDGEKKTPIYMNASEGKYFEHNNDRFNNMYYAEEEKRGFFPEENHAVPGRYEIKIKANKEKDIFFVCSLDSNVEEIKAKDVIDSEINRINDLIQKSELEEHKEIVKRYIIATDNFVVYRPAFKLHTLIAGYPWFLDWGRDSLISFEGITLISKRYDIAREVLLTIIHDQNQGLIPNGYSGFDNRPLYNSVDSGLLLFEQVKKYLDYTDDYKFVKNKMYEVLIKIVDNYKTGIDIDGNNIYLDKDALLVSGSRNTQNTWMDAKIGNLPVTPRNGKAVEINALWFNALKILADLCTEFGDKDLAKKYRTMATRCQKSFEKQFYNPDKKCLYDVIGDDKIRPNQLYALSLTYQIINPKTQIAREIFYTVTKKLVNDYGLKTLAKGEEKYTEVYEGDSTKRDMSYHQGITWPWLLGLYSDAFKNIVNSAEKEKEVLESAYKKFVEDVKDTFMEELEEGRTVGSISELYDSKRPYESKGTIAQCWSVAEIFRIILG